MNVLTPEEVVEKTTLSKSSIRRREEEGTFPSRIKLSDSERKSRTGWIEEEIDQWIEERDRVYSANEEEENNE